MEIIVTATAYHQFSEDGNPVQPPSCSTIESSVKEVLKSLGFPVQTNSFYVIIKQLMERIAPVMIDHQGLLRLFNNVSDSLLGDGEIDVQYGIENSAKRGLQLILALSSVFPAIFHGREIFTEYLLPFLWHDSDNPQIAEVVLQILANIGSSASSYHTTDSDNDGNIVSVPWWAADEDTIPRLIEKFIIKRKFFASMFPFSNHVLFLQHPPQNKQNTPRSVLTRLFRMRMRRSRFLAKY